MNEAIEVLTGMPAGEPKEDGSYPEGTVNFLVDKRLKEMSKKLKADDKGDERKKKEENNDTAPKKEPEPLP